MSIIKDIVQDHINELDHEPEKIYDGSWRQVYPEPDWDSVAEDVLDALEAHIDVEFLETDGAFEVVQKGVQSVKNSAWLEAQLEEARRSWHDDHECRSNPHGYYGVSRHEFI